MCNTITALGMKLVGKNILAASHDRNRKHESISAVQSRHFSNERVKIQHVRYTTTAQFSRTVIGEANRMDKLK